MDPSSFSVMVGVISAALSGFLTLVVTKGVDAWLKLRADKREDVKLEDDREDQLTEKEDNTLRYIIGIQQGELAALRAEVKEMQASHRTELRSIHNAHNECEKRQAKLETELSVRMQFMSERMGKVEARAGQSGDAKLTVEVVDNDALTKAVEETKSAIHQEVRKGVHDIRDDLHAASLKHQADAAEGKLH